VNDGRHIKFSSCRATKPKPSQTFAINAFSNCG